MVQVTSPSADTPFLKDVHQSSEARDELVRGADAIVQQYKDYSDGIKDVLRTPTGKLPPKLAIHEIIGEVEIALNAPDWELETPICIPRHIFLWMYSDQSSVAHGRVQGVFDRVYVSEQPNEAGFLELECDLSSLREDLDATVLLAQVATQLYKLRAGLPNKGYETDESDSDGAA